MLVINMLLTLATLVLAGFSILQARATRDAADQARRQADALDVTLSETRKIAAATLSNTDAAIKQASLLEKSFAFTHRPKLIVRNIVTNRAVSDGKDDPFYENALLGGQFYVQNVGDSRATVSESGCWVIWKKNDAPLAGLPMKRPYEGKEGNNPLSMGATLLPGETLTAIFQSEDYLTYEAQRAFVSVIGRSTLWVGLSTRMTQERNEGWLSAVGTIGPKVVLLLRMIPTTSTDDKLVWPVRRASQQPRNPVTQLRRRARPRPLGAITRASSFSQRRPSTRKQGHAPGAVAPLPGGSGGSAWLPNPIKRARSCAPGS